MRVEIENRYPNEKIDIVLLSCNRKDNTKKTIDDLYDRVNYPEKIRLIVVDNCSIDGTYEMLQEYRKNGKVNVLISSPKDSTISEAYNIGFKVVESEYWIAQQDDITIPKLGPKDVIEQLIDLMEKYPKQAGIGCRIQIIPNMNWQEGDLTSARKSLSAYFRIQRKDEFYRMGMLNPKKDYDDVNFKVRTNEILGMDCSWANNLWCDHSRGHKPNRGYNVKSRWWGVPGTIHGRTELTPYPEIDPITNKPLNIK